MTDKKYQIFDDDYIIRLCKSIIKAIKNIAVITIGLSPECCGGWETSISKAQLIASTFGFDFTIDCDIV